VLQVGTSENKNIDRVIDALTGLDATLVIVGKLDDRHREKIRRAGIAFESFEGISRQQLIDEYERADILIFASLYEGFGMPIVEAQAVGRPVITSNVCSMPEVADGAALMVDPKNTAEIRNAICELSANADLRNSLVARGFKNARRFSASAIAEKYAALYREIAA